MHNFNGHLLGAKVRIHPSLDRGSVFRHMNDDFYNVPFDPKTNADWSGDTTFYVVPGLDGKGGSISFRSTLFPNRYIRHDNYVLCLRERTDIGPDDLPYASWTPGSALSDAKKSNNAYFSFTSLEVHGAVLNLGSSFNSDLLRTNDQIPVDVLGKNGVTKDTASLYVEIIEAPTPVKGAWNLIFSAKNMDWVYKKGVEVGITTEDTVSRTTTTGSSWTVSGERSAGMSAEGLSASIKAMFSFSKNESESITRSHAFKKLETQTQEIDINPQKPGDYYLWQWQWSSTTADGVQIVVKTLQFETTPDKNPPTSEPS